MNALIVGQQGQLTGLIEGIFVYSWSYMGLQGLYYCLYSQKSAVYYMDYLWTLSYRR